MNLISCSEARERGLIRYFTGKPCGRGHVAERFVVSRSCVVCGGDRASAHYEANRDVVLAKSAQRYSENRESILQRQHRHVEGNRGAVLLRKRQQFAANRDAQLARNRQGYQNNREAILVKQRRYAKDHPEKFAAKRALRRSRERQAVPPWFGELDQLVWLEAADLARSRRTMTGFDWQADHMIPLAARLASGLHVAQNCQVIPAALNNRKQNALVLTTPLEWLHHL